MSDVPIVAIVDDDASIRGATAKLVRLSGFSAHAFASAEEFLQSPRVRDSACLITDMKMPGMSGLDLLHHLAGLGNRMPVIFITAFPDETSRAGAAADAVCVLAKPFDGQALIDCLDQALRGQGRS